MRQMLLSVDGAGSGLDADTVDGLHASSFVLKAGDTMTGSLTVSMSGTGGPFTISTPGGTTGFSMANTKRADFRWDDSKIYILASTSSSAPATTDGITIENGGNVGIKNASPAYTLDITGTVRISSNVGFYNTTPIARPAAYTQTYATATRTHAAVTSTAPSAYAAGANGYSTGAKASEVHAAVIASRNDIINIKQVLNQVIDDLQAYGLLQ